ncbi:MAG: SCO family protein [Deltaproteobacteria bacterium]|nr:SCO family protein [Deltaproteobacteria bacterium]
MRFSGKKFIFLIFILCFSLSQAAELATTDQKSSLSKSEDAIGRNISDYRLIDQDGKEFNTSEFAGKPFVVSFIYTSCIHICPTITLNLSNAVKQKEKQFGKDFRFLTVSFDPERDTPQKLKEFGSNFTKDFAHWKFATADKETIERMAGDFGFFFKKEGDHFQHINVVSVVDANGNILTHVYGIDFKPDQVLNPIYFPDQYKKQKKAGVAGLFEKVTLFCYKYDPATNTYKLDYPLLLKMTLEGTLLFSILFFVWKKEIMGFFSRFRRKKE